jgi:MFS family permease
MILVMIFLMAEITYVVEAKEKKKSGIFSKGGAHAQAYGLYFFLFTGGAVVGPIWAGFMVKRAGWGTMAWSFGLLSGLTAIPVLFFTGGLIMNSESRKSEGSERIDQFNFYPGITEIPAYPDLFKVL